MKRDFKGIWIPKEIWLSSDLTLQEKVFLVEISSLDNSEGCFANNQYFSNFFGISKTRVSLIIKSLIEKGYISSQLIYKEGTKQILKRVLNISYIPYLTKVKEPIQQKLKDNNTLSNTSNNTIKKEELSFCFYDTLKNKIFNDWLNYRKEIKKPIKAKSTLIRLADKFEKESLEKCKFVVSASISNQYQGLFWDNYKEQNSKTELSASDKLKQSLGL